MILMVMTGMKLARTAGNGVDDPVTARNDKQTSDE